MRMTITAACAALAVTTCCGLASAQCQSDGDCAGDMICDNGTCVAPAASAAPAPAPAATSTGGGRVRLDLNLSLIGFTYSKVDKDADEGYKDFAFNFGPMPTTRLGFGIGYSLDERISIGARLILGFGVDRPKEADDEDDGDKTTIVTFNYSVLPYLEYAFGTGKVQPYLTALVGLDGTVSRTKYQGEEAGEDYTVRDTTAYTMGALGFGGGAHVFLADRVSLDLWLVEIIGLGAVDDSYKTEQPGPDEDEDDKTFVWQARTELFIGITGWI